MSAAPPRAPAFWGWWIVGVAFAAQALSIGFTIIPYGLFTPSIEREFGASTALSQLGLGVFTVVMTLSGPVVGPILDRHSIRAVMCGGATLLSVSFLALSLATELWQIALLFGVLASVGVTMMGPLSATTVVAKWFERRRGLAVGLAAMGPPAGGLVLVPLAGGLIEALGWRGTLQVFAAINLGFVPLAWLIVRNRPEDVGQLPDGGAPRMVGPAAPGATGALWSSAKLLRTRSFWAMALGLGIVFGFGGGWNANVPKFGQDLGHSLSSIAWLMGIGAGLGIPGTLLFGALADRFDNRSLLWASIAIQIGALLVLRSQPSFAWLTGALWVFGFSAGGLLPVYASLIGRLFGPLSFGRVMGLAGVVMMPFGAAAPVIAGALRDAAGDYRAALGMVALAFAAGAVTLVLVKPPRPAFPGAAAQPARGA
ncbi:MAG: MFS transporter [Proteobacteria bacterium]|nr:MFS transporter [Pseudomonadota bacterium]